MASIHGSCPKKCWGFISANNTDRARWTFLFFTTPPAPVTRILPCVPRATTGATHSCGIFWGSMPHNSIWIWTFQLSAGARFTSMANTWVFTTSAKRLKQTILKNIMALPKEPLIWLKTKITLNVAT